MIEILPESEGNILGIRAVGAITEEDYRHVFNPLVEELLKKYANVRILCLLDQGVPHFSAGRVWEHPTFRLNDKQVLKKIAVVGDSLRIKWGVGILAGMTGGNFKTFPTRKLGRAWDWVKA